MFVIVLVIWIIGVVLFMLLFIEMLVWCYGFDLVGYYLLIFIVFLLLISIIVVGVLVVFLVLDDVDVGMMMVL